MVELSEKISENKRRRGRPRCFSEQLEAMYTSFGVADSCQTRRGKMNWYHGNHALSELKDEPGLGWLFNWADLMAGTGKARWTILSELGRLRDPKLIRSMAHEMCELKPRTDAAVRMIREERTGAAPAPSTSKLTDALLRTLNDYRATHWGTSTRMVRDALRQVHDAVAAVESKPTAKKGKG